MRSTLARFAMSTTDAVTMDKIVALCKRRGFIFPSSEIYGGIGSTYDYGHYGLLLKNNVKAAWWRSMLQERDDIVALDSAILQHPRVWEASGSVKPLRWPLASHTRGCCRIAESRATMSSRSCSIERHHAALTLFFSSSP